MGDDENGKVVPIRSRSRPRFSPSEARMDEFLEHVRSGEKVKDAMSLSGIKWGTYTRWLEDPEFRAIYFEARAAVNETRTVEVEDTLYEMATSGEDTRATETWLRAHHPERYQEKLRIEHSLAPSDDDLDEFRALGADPEFLKAAAVIARTVGRLDDPDIVDEA